MTQTPPPAASAPQPPFGGPVPGGPWPGGPVPGGPVPGGPVPGGPVPGMPPGPPPARLSAAAVCALVASCVALVPVGVVLGIVALFRTQRLRLRGRKLAVVALSLCAAWTALGMVAIIATAAALGAHQGPLDAFGAGTCFTYTNGTDASEGVDVVDCANDHDGQIVARHSLGDSFPGQDTSASESVIGCMADSAGALPDAEHVDPSVARLRAYFPDQEQWDAGMHAGICVLMPIGSQQLQGDALDGSSLTPVQRQVLRLTNEAALIRLKLHDLPNSGWKLAAPLERRLAVVDRTESAALNGLASTPSTDSAFGLSGILRGLASADTSEAAQADATAARITDSASWQSLVTADTTTSPATDAAYRALRRELQLTEQQS